MTSTAPARPDVSGLRLSIGGELVDSPAGLDVIDPARAEVFTRVPAATPAQLDAAEAVARRLDAGSVWVNQHPMLSPEAPFGGRKQSGIGVESSLLGLHAYTDVSVLRIKRAVR
jgi:acyl-CoA reductase-like NAD-dependent aldehyde dehydrogenase